ncbi:hypothetical protein D3C81_1232200 [compost metagenome]
MVIGVPVLVEHVVAHDETDGTVRQFIIDKNGFLMMGRCRRQDELRGGADLRVETFVFRLMGYFGPFKHAETATDEHRSTASRQMRSGHVVGKRTVGKPLAVISILLIHGGLQLPVVVSEWAFTGQVGFSGFASGIEWHFPPQYPHLDAFSRHGHQQFTDTRRYSIADEIHRRLKAPADDVDSCLGL